MSYENAPATHMLATHCAVCSRPLVDAASVEAGMGPDCRDRHGYNDPVAEAARPEANKLVHDIALGVGLPELIAALARLRALGLGRLAGIIEARRADIKVEEHGNLLHVSTPFSEDAIGAWRTVPGRRWDKALKVNVVPAAQKVALWALFKRCYPGTLGVGPRGLFAVAEVR